MQDRIASFPNRVTATPVAGQANTFDIVRADEPTQAGTPLNKANLLSDETEVDIWGSAANRTVNAAFGKLSSSVWQVGDVRTTVSNTLDDSWLLANGASIAGAEYPTLAPMLPRAMAQASMYNGTTLTASTASGRSLSRSLYLNGYYIIKDSFYGYLYYAQDLAAGFQSVRLSPACSQKVFKYISGLFVGLYSDGSTHRILWSASPGGAWSYSSVLSSGTYSLIDFTFDGTSWAALWGSGVIYCSSGISGPWAAKASLPQATYAATGERMFSGNGYTVLNYDPSYPGAYYTTNLSQTSTWNGTSAITCFLGFCGGKFWGYVTVSSGVYDIYVGNTPLTMTTKIGTILTNAPIVGSVQYDNGAYYVRSSSAIYATADMSAGSLKSLSDLPTVFETINTQDKCVANGTLMQITTTKVYKCPVNDRLLPSISVSGAYAYVKGV